MRQFLLILLSLTLSACATMVDPEASQELRDEPVVVVEPGKAVEQSFISRRPRFNGILVWLGSAQGETPLEGPIHFDLFEFPEEKIEPIQSWTYYAAEVARSGSITLPVTPQENSLGQAYRLRIDTNQSQLYLWGRAEETYPEGRASSNGVPIPGDLAFQLTYEYGPAAMMDDLKSAWLNFWLLIPLVLTLWLPGRVLLELFELSHGKDWGERTALSVGISLSAIPVLMTWTTAAGLKWTQKGVWIALIGLGALYLWLIVRQSWLAPRISTEGEIINREQVGFADLLSDHLSNRPSTVLRILWSSRVSLLLAVILLATFAVRLVMVRDLAAPAWVDSVHHALIVRLILEKGGFPADYSPFLNKAIAGYHSGFHSVEAVFQWLSGMDLARGMLLFGQAANALAVLAVYLFTLTFTHSRKAGLAAAVIAGLVTPMPAYYTSWGRYTQLFGLLILPASVYLIFVLYNFGDQSYPTSRWKPGLLAALTSAGLFLTHYRVLAFLVMLLLADLFTRAATRMLSRFLRHSSSKPAVPLKKQIAWLAFTGLLAAVLTLPWWSETLATMVGPKLTWGSGAARLFSDFSWGYLTAALGKYSLYMAAAGFLLALVSLRRFPMTLLVWGTLLFLLANLSPLGLPGGTFVNNTSVEISLFMPLAALGGYAAASLADILGKVMPCPLRSAPKIILLAGMLGAGVAGARAQLPLLNPITFLVREADRPAILWIEENLPPGETVLINPFNWGYGTYAGQDGGYWIGPLAGHPTFPPPVLYGLDNNGQRILDTSETARQVMEAGKDPQKLKELMQAQDIHYVYVGRRGGKLSPAALEASPLFDLIYSAEGTWVFKVVSEQVVR